MPSLFTKILKRKKKEKEDKEKKEIKKEATPQAGRASLSKAERGVKSEKKETEEKEPVKKPVKLGKSDIASVVLVNPRITEKTNIQAEQGVYTFNIAKRSNKNLVKKAVEELYHVGVDKVRISNMPSKSRFVRGKRGIRPGYKKAVVYLKEGDKIEFV